jgi:hypothetical protein
MTCRLKIGFLRHGRAKRMFLSGVKSVSQTKTSAKHEALPRPSEIFFPP